MRGVYDVRKFVERYSETITEHMKTACDFLPVAYARECRNKVIHKIRRVIDVLVDHSNPQPVCRKLGMCDKTAGIPYIKHPVGLIAREGHGDVDVN